MILAFMLSIVWCNSKSEHGEDTKLYKPVCGPRRQTGCPSTSP